MHNVWFEDTLVCHFSRTLKKTWKSLLLRHSVINTSTGHIPIVKRNHSLYNTWRITDWPQFYQPPKTMNVCLLVVLEQKLEWGDKGGVSNSGERIDQSLIYWWASSFSRHAHDTSFKMYLYKIPWISIQQLWHILAQIKAVDWPVERWTWPSLQPRRYNIVTATSNKPGKFQEFFRNSQHTAVSSYH